MSDIDKEWVKIRKEFIAMMDGRRPKLFISSDNVTDAVIEGTNIIVKHYKKFVIDNISQLHEKSHYAFILMLAGSLLSVLIGLLMAADNENISPENTAIYMAEILQEAEDLFTKMCKVGEP